MNKREKMNQLVKLVAIHPETQGFWLCWRYQGFGINSTQEWDAPYVGEEWPKLELCRVGEDHSCFTWKSRPLIVSWVTIEKDERP